MQIKNNLGLQLRKLSKEILNTADVISKLESLTHYVQETKGNDRLAGQTVSQHIYEDIKRLDEQIDKLEIKLNVIIAGRFRSGKSTFINALLRKEVALMDETEMTYTLNYITHSKDGIDKARIYFRDGKVSDSSIDQLNKLLLAERENESFRDTIYKIEMFYPYPEINEINIWDTPGLGSTTTANRETTLNLIPEADVVLWVLDSSALGDELDKKDVEDIVRLNKPVIAILNKIDTVGNTEQTRSAILNFIDQNYGKVFKTIHFCSSLEAWNGVRTNNTEAYSESGLNAINEYLEHSIFNNKKEIIYGSAIGTIREILTSIDSTILNFYDYTNDRLSNFITFIKELDSKTLNVLDILFKEIKVYIDTNAFEQEYHSSIFGLERGLGKVGEIGFKATMERAVHKYTEDVWNLGRQRMRDIWQNSVYESEDVIKEETQAFSISQSFAQTSDIVRGSELTTTTTQEGIALSVGGGTVALSILSGASVATSLFAGVGIGLVAFFIAGMNATKDQNADERHNLQNELLLYKQKFYNDVFLGQLAPKLSSLNNECRQLLVERSEKHFLIMGNEAQNREIIQLVSLNSEHINEMFAKLDESLMTLGEETRNLFRNEIEHSNFIILAGNPNPGIKKLSELLQTAQRYVYFVDAYFNLKSLSWVDQINPGITVKILLYHIDNEFEKHHAFITALQRLREGRKAPIIVRFIKYKNTQGTPLHDRFIFTGQWGLSVGNGLDAIGLKDINVSYISDFKIFQNKFFDSYWDMKSMKTENKDRQVLTYDV